MKRLLLSIALVPLLAWAAGDHGPEATKKDIERHRAMAAAHEQMAKCLQSGQKSDACLKALQDACKGLAIGKYCGMRHEH